MKMQMGNLATLLHQEFQAAFRSKTQICPQCDPAAKLTANGYPELHFLKSWYKSQISFLYGFSDGSKTININLG